MSRPFDEAIERARVHLRLASVEGLETARALMDAVTIAAGRSASAPGKTSREIAAALDDLIAHMRAGGGLSVPGGIALPLAQALDREIERWQQRSRTEPEARAVLRAFLGLRELLWELGVRVEPAADQRSNARSAGKQEEPKREPDAETPPRGRSPRVQRFDVES